MQMSACRSHRRLLLAVIVFGMVAGCNSDRRLVELSRESLNRQAEQNQQMAHQNETLTETTQKLIQSESDVHHDASQLHEQLHAERSALDQQREELEGERRSLATDRRRDSALAQAIPAIVGLIIAALPLIVCWYLVSSLFLSRSDDSIAAEVLIEHLTNQGPLVGVSAQSGLSPAEGSTTNLLSHERPLLVDPKAKMPGANRSGLRAIVVVEGSHDVEFLKRISRLIVESETGLPDLGRQETAGIITFVVNNGGSIVLPGGLAPNGLAEFHLLDRETGHVTAQREDIVEAINTRSNCVATLTSKRAIENYLHPDAIREAAGIQIAFGDFDDVAEMAAKATFNANEGDSWESLSRRARRRLRDKAKRLLNREAVDQMTPERLAERDPQGEVIGWLRTIAELGRSPATTLD